MRFEILGPLRVEADGAEVEVAGGRARSVLAVLLVAGGRAVGTDRLIDQVWGEDLPANPANTLQHAVAQIRKVLEPGRARNEPPRILRSTDDGYRLALEDHDVDAARFERLVTDAALALDDDRPAQALAAANEALDLWRGPALAGFDDVPVVEAERVRLEERRLDAHLLALDARSAAQGPGSVVADLESLVVAHPRREGLWARLMTALYQVDRQADALRTYQRAADRLAESGLSPSPALRELEQRILGQDETLRPTTPTTPPVAHNLPTPPTPIVGRETELLRVGEALGSHRLLTLVGPGGSGKTRLAVEVGRRLVDGRSLDHRADTEADTDTGVGTEVGADGVRLVRLDDLADPSLLGAALAEAVDMPESWSGDLVPTLVEFIGRRRLLLIVDNCEHLLDSVAPLVARLLAACDHLRVLATSQAPLEIGGERRLPVPPLGLPGQSGSPFARLDEAPAVRLFLDRAEAVAPDLIPTLEAGDAGAEGELAAVANIVAALDGLPLAIELAAARCDLYTPIELARLLGDQLDRLDQVDLLDRGARDAPARQQTLRAAVTWSLGLLSDDERRFVGLVSVFAGGFDAESAAAVTGTGLDEVRRHLAGLVVRSVLWRMPAGGGSRFRLPETIRHLALDLLGGVLDEAEQERARSAHARFFADRATATDALLAGAGQAEAHARLVVDADNYRAAMAHALAADPADRARLEVGVRIAARLGRFWDWRGSLAEANTWTSRFVTAAGIPDDGRAAGPIEPMADLGLLVGWYAYLSSELDDRDRARRLSDLALEVAEAEGDAYGLAVATSAPAMQARLGGDPALALTYNQRIRDGVAHGTLDDAWIATWADNHDALCLTELGRLDEAEAAALRSEAGFAALGDRRGQGWALIARAVIALERGHGGARALAEQALAVASETNDGRNAAWATELAARALRLEGDGPGAEEREREAEALRSERGMRRSPWQHDRGRDQH